MSRRKTRDQNVKKRVKGEERIKMKSKKKGYWWNMMVLMNPAVTSLDILLVENWTKIICFYSFLISTFMFLFFIFLCKFAGARWSVWDPLNKAFWMLSRQGCTLRMGSCCTYHVSVTYSRPKIKFLFSGATFHMPLTKSATLNRLLHCSL